jgi:hypothetical protein
MNDRLADRTAAYFFQFPLRNATISRNYSLERKRLVRAISMALLARVRDDIAKMSERGGSDSASASGVSFAGAMYCAADLGK